MLTSFIFARCDNFKMVWVYAQSIFTKVAHMETFWDNSILKMQHSPMGRAVSNFIVGNSVCVPIMRFDSEPFPTPTLNLFNLHKKSFFSRQIRINAHSWHTTTGTHRV